MEAHGGILPKAEDTRPSNVDFDEKMVDQGGSFAIGPILPMVCMYPFTVLPMFRHIFDDVFPPGSLYIILLPILRNLQA